MFICATVNQKGGVGKTATVIHTGAALAAAGYRVLMMDVDLRHGLTKHFQLQGREAVASDVIFGRVSLLDAAVAVRDRLWVVPASGALENAELQLTSTHAGERRLRRVVANFKQQCGQKTPWDFVFVDCASGWGTVTRNAILAADAIMVPINSESPAIVDAVETIGMAQELAEFNECKFSLLGVLLTRYRTTNSADAVARLASATWGDKVFAARIRQAERINELAIRHQTLADLSPSAAGDVGADYKHFADEFLQRVRLFPNGAKLTRQATRKRVMHG